MLKWVALGDPKETAWAILRSTALGEHELYYPPGQHGKLLVHIRHLFPSVLDNMAEMYASEAARKQPGKHMN